MHSAVLAALRDTGLAVEKLQPHIDSIDVVRSWTWPCDYPALLAEKLGVQLLHAKISDHGGNQPAKLLDLAARRIAAAHAKLVVLTGGEALASCKC